MSQHVHIQEVQLSAIRLTPSEEAGLTSRTYGLIPSRSHQPPHNRAQSPASVFFVWPEPSRHHPVARSAR
jgi:hypothetical protein